MKVVCSSINWRRTALIGLRIVGVGAGHALAVSSRLLKAGSVACEKLGGITRETVRRIDPHVH